MFQGGNQSVRRCKMPQVYKNQLQYWDFMKSGARLRYVDAKAFLKYWMKKTIKISAM
jgi:hypothetical protein